MLPRAEASSTDFIAAAASAEMVPPIAAFHVARLESSCARGTCAADVDRVCVRGARVGEASGEEWSVMRRGGRGRGKSRATYRAIDARDAAEEPVAGEDKTCDEPSLRLFQWKGVVSVTSK